MMPGWVATPFAEDALYVCSLLDHLGVEHIAHYGTLLGAVRLGGVAPWDEDTDLYVRGWTLPALADLLAEPLGRAGFEVLPLWDDALCIRRRPWLAGQGHVGISVLPDPFHDATDPATFTWDALLLQSEYAPRQRVPFYSSWVWGPARAEPVLARIYGHAGSEAVMARYSRPPLADEAAAFWRAARPLDGPRDWAAIETRFATRARSAGRYAHALTWAWWWANGAYNEGVRRVRATGRRLAG
jgi:hypothetical protein